MWVFFDLYLFCKVCQILLICSYFARGTRLCEATPQKIAMRKKSIVQRSARENRFVTIPWLSVAIFIYLFSVLAAWLISWLFCVYPWLFLSRGYFCCRVAIFYSMFSNCPWLFVTIFVRVAIFWKRVYFRGYFRVAIFLKHKKTR